MSVLIILEETLSKSTVGKLRMDKILPLVELAMSRFAEEENDWIPIGKKMPGDHHIFIGSSEEVIVTDGKEWGYGRYCYEPKKWLCQMVGKIESTGNDITHWKPAPKLPV